MREPPPPSEIVLAPWREVTVTFDELPAETAPLTITRPAALTSADVLGRRHCADAQRVHAVVVETHRPAAGLSREPADEVARVGEHDLTGCGDGQHPLTEHDRAELVDLVGRAREARAGRRTGPPGGREASPMELTASDAMPVSGWSTSSLALSPGWVALNRDVRLVRDADALELAGAGRDRVLPGDGSVQELGDIVRRPVVERVVRRRHRVAHRFESAEADHLHDPAQASPHRPGARPPALRRVRRARRAPAAHVQHAPARRTRTVAAVARDPARRREQATGRVHNPAHIVTADAIDRQRPNAPKAHPPTPVDRVAATGHAAGANHDRVVGLPAAERQTQRRIGNGPQQR